MIEPSRDKKQIVEGLNPELEVPFGRPEYERRRVAVRAAMADAGIDTLYVSDPDSLNYLCGYKALWYQAYGHSGWGPVGGLALNAGSDRAMLFDTEKERVLGGYSTLGVEFHLLRRYTKPMIEFIIDDLTADGWLEGTVALETGSYRPFPKLSAEFQGLIEAAGAKVVDGTELVRAARRDKSTPEMAQIRTASRIADRAIERGLEVLEPGVSEIEVYGEMYRAMTAAGGDVPAMTPLVRSGPKSAVRNASPARRTVLPGELVTLSVFGCFNRYHSFTSRTAVVGDVGGKLVDRMNDLAETAREVIADAGPSGSAGFVEAAEAAIGSASLIDASGHELGVAMPPDPIGYRRFDRNRRTAFGEFLPGDAVAFEVSILVPELSGSIAVGETVLFEEGGSSILSPTSTDLREVGR